MSRVTRDIVMDGGSIYTKQNAIGLDTENEIHPLY